MEGSWWKGTRERDSINPAGYAPSLSVVAEVGVEMTGRDDWTGTKKTASLNLPKKRPGQGFVRQRTFDEVYHFPCESGREGEKEPKHRSFKAPRSGGAQREERMLNGVDEGESLSSLPQSHPQTKPAEEQVVIRTRL